MLEVGAGREELVKRGIEKPDHHRETVHRLEQALEVTDLELLQLGRGPSAPLRSSERMISWTTCKPFAEEHVLGPGETDSFGAPFPRRRASSAVSALARTPSSRISSAQDNSSSQLGNRLRVDEVQGPEEDGSARAVDGYHVAGVELVASGRAPCRPSTSAVRAPRRR